MKQRFFLLFCAVFFIFPSFAQNAQSREKAAVQDPAALIGTTLADLFSGYGAPKSVYPVRGLAPWQDDVVFTYDNIEFFISGNRVWQVKIQSFGTFKQSDPKAQVLLAMGPGQDFDGYSLFHLPSKVWPLMLRVNWDTSGRAQAIYLYRSDF